jgi:Spy/CpxP family protein refolding chaperone
MTLPGFFMKLRRLILLAGFSLVAIFTVRAGETNAPATPAHPAPTPQSAETTGIAIGGPVGTLTEQQLASYEKAWSSQRGRLAELQNQLRLARQDLLATSLDEKFNESVIHEKALAVAKIDAEMIVLRVRVFSQVQPPLTPEQKEKIKAGQQGPIHPLNRPAIERPPRRESAAGTNHDDSGLPPKQ